MDEIGEREAIGATPGLWRNRDFVTVFLGQGVSNLGDGVTATALPLLVLQLTGSGVAMGVVGMLQLLPNFFLDLPVGALADRWDRRHLLFAVDAGRALLTALIPLALLLRLPVMPVVYAVALPIGALATLFWAGYSASVPLLAGRAHLGRANSYFQAVQSLAWIVGPGAAGLLATWIGPGPALVLDAASFVVSAASIGLVHRPLRDERAGPPRHIVHEMREGLAFVAAHPALRAAVGLRASTSFLAAPLIAAIVFAVTVNWRLAPSVVGFALSAYALGALLGALLGGRVERLHPDVVMLAANAGRAAALLAMALASGVVSLLVAAAAFGLGEGLMRVVYLTLLARLTPDRLMGRVASIANSLVLGMRSVGVLAGGILLQAAGGAATLGAMGGGLLLVSLLFGALPAVHAPPATPPRG
jgi:MFS transporter, ENTS family, enterobactin (siderophore) exporter